jgi:hypothetical protein
MPDLAKSSIWPCREISTGALLQALAAHADKPLVFAYGGHDVLPGYHVTEVKSGRFEALDCGANSESWRETFIQLWDIPPEPGKGFMPVGKFLAIMRKAGEHVPFDPQAKLTFEVSDGVGAMQILRASSIDVAGDTVRVALTPRAASCKPRDRWLEQGEPKTVAETACCGTKPAACCA